MPVEHTALRQRAYAAIESLPRPVTVTAALDAARPILPAKEYGEFAKWIDRNGAAFLGRLNG